MLTGRRRMLSSTFDNLSQRWWNSKFQTAEFSLIRGLLPSSIEFAALHIYMAFESELASE
jgi:hypothetical protein